MRRVETALLVKVLKFDLNIGLNPRLTIEARFTRENTNDIGEYLLPQTAHIIIMEFKKFMYMQATEIRTRLSQGTLDLQRNYKKDKKWFFSSPYTASPYLDRVWRLLILYNNNYERFCQRICGGFIDREDPRENHATSFQNYYKGIEQLELKRDVMKPFHNLWPRYKNKADYITDYDYNCYVSGEAIPIIIGYMNQRTVDASSSRIETETCKNLASQCFNDHMSTSSKVDTELTVVKDRNVYHNLLQDRDQTPAEILYSVLDIVFPPKFLSNLQVEQLIDENTANKWFLEYRKYLVLAYLTKDMISPSEQVDQVWHLHMTYTQHYRATCQNILQREFKHTPSLGGSAESKKYEGVYEETLSFYKAVFLIDPPQDVWETPQQRFEMANFEFRNLNLFRLAVLYSMKVVNPDFLQIKAPPVVYNQNDLKNLPPQQKKLIIRRNRRNKYYNRNLPYGWRRNHNQNSNVKNSDDRRRDNDDYGYYGPGYMVGGGPIIIGDPFDEDCLNSPDFGDILHEGFYDDLGPGLFHKIGLDDIADFAEADVDLMGEGNLAEYGGNDLGIKNFGEDLGINRDMADLGVDDGIDFNAEDGGVSIANGQDLAVDNAEGIAGGDADGIAGADGGGIDGADGGCAGGDGGGCAGADGGGCAGADGGGCAGGDGGCAGGDGGGCGGGDGGGCGGGDGGGCGGDGGGCGGCGGD
jgi:hypothetical protein